MSLTSRVTFVVAVPNRQIIDRNFLISPCLAYPHSHQILVQENFACAGKAYNQGIDMAENDLVIFCHSDILLPQGWLDELQKAIDRLEIVDPNWGVLGVSGKTQDGRGWGHVYSSGRGIIGAELEQPVPIQTLDEIVLILRKSSALRFDEAMPHFHFYGTDICLRAAKLGRKSYAVSAFCIHNTHQNLILSDEFYECCRYTKRIWKDALPIQTTCVRITRSGIPVLARRVKEFYLRHIRHKEFGGTRLQDPSPLLREFAGKR
jgi:glycosyltransferase involved in cell wall biosynthesis